MSEFRAGYDVVETLFLEETEFGATPATGEWQATWLTTNFDPRPRPTIKEKIGLGRQLPSKYLEVKRFGEFTLEAEMLAKVTSPAYEWSKLFWFIVTDQTYGATFDLGKRLKSFSLGAKLDLAADEFWHLKGCKLTRFEIRSDGVDQVLRRIASGICQNYDYTTTDYVVAPATRQSPPVPIPATAYLKHGDADIMIDAGSGYGDANILYSRLNSWSFIMERTLQKRGTDPTIKTLYRAFAEERCNVKMRLNLDFNSRVELEQFIDSTEIDLKLQLPTGTDGRQIIVSDGKWLEHSTPKREIDLISVDLMASFTNLAVTTL